MKISVRPATQAPDELVATVRNEVAKRLGPDLALNIELSDDFVRSGEGKTPTFLRTFPLNSSGLAPMTKSEPN